MSDDVPPEFRSIHAKADRLKQRFERELQRHAKAIDAAHAKMADLTRKLQQVVEQHEAEVHAASEKFRKDIEQLVAGPSRARSDGVLDFPPRAKPDNPIPGKPPRPPRPKKPKPGASGVPVTPNRPNTLSGGAAASIDPD